MLRIIVLICQLSCLLHFPLCLSFEALELLQITITRSCSGRCKTFLKETRGGELNWSRNYDAAVMFIHHSGQ